MAGLTIGLHRHRPESAVARIGLVTGGAIQPFADRCPTQGLRHAGDAADRRHMQRMGEFEAGLLAWMGVERDAGEAGMGPGPKLDRWRELRMIGAEIARIGQPRVGQLCLQRGMAIGAEFLCGRRHRLVAPMFDMAIDAPPLGPVEAMRDRQAQAPRKVAGRDREREARRIGMVVRLGVARAAAFVAHRYEGPDVARGAVVRQVCMRRR